MGDDSGSPARASDGISAGTARLMARRIASRIQPRRMRSPAPIEAGLRWSQSLGTCVTGNKPNRPNRTPPTHPWPARDGGCTPHEPVGTRHIARSIELPAAGATPPPVTLVPLLQRTEEAQHRVALGGPQSTVSLLRACGLAAVELDRLLHGLRRAVVHEHLREAEPHERLGAELGRPRAPEADVGALGAHVVEQEIRPCLDALLPQRAHGRAAGHQCGPMAARAADAAENQAAALALAVHR